MILRQQKEAISEPLRRSRQFQFLIWGSFLLGMLPIAFALAPENWGQGFLKNLYGFYILLFMAILVLNMTPLGAVFTPFIFVFYGFAMEGAAVNAMRIWEAQHQLDRGAILLHALLLPLAFLLAVWGMEISSHLRERLDADSTVLHAVNGECAAVFALGLLVLLKGWQYI